MEAEWRGIIYIVPTALQKSGRDVQKRFTNLDAVREELFRQLSVFPIPLLRLLSKTQRGQLIITAEGAEYNPETQIAKVSVKKVPKVSKVPEVPKVFRFGGSFELHTKTEC